MQERIVGIIKDVWETLKKEIKGPRIMDADSKSYFPNVIDKKITIEKEISIKTDKKDIKIREANENIDNLIIYESILKEKSHNVAMLSSEFTIKTEKINFDGIKTKSNNIDFKRDKNNVNKTDLKKVYIDIKKIKADSFKTDVKLFLFKWIKNIKDGEEIIFSIPKKIIGKYEYDFSREEYSAILEKIKKKLPRRDVYNYKIESIFKNIPVKNVKNIKFFVDKNELEIYLKKGLGNETADFVIIRSRITGIIEKIFI